MMIDVSLRQVLRQKNTTYAPPQLDNLYRLSTKVGSQQADLIFSQDILSQTKFYPVLLKEWFWAVKPFGFIEVSFQENQLLDARKLQKVVEWLLRNDVRIQEMKTNFGTVTMVLQKVKDSLILGDSIEKWTFGILTAGQRNGLLWKLIESIRKQRIPRYEVIICGDFKCQDDDCRVIPFPDEKYPLGWITRKKNLIVSQARFENVCMLHDRVVLDDNWHEGMKKYGNNFEVLGCRVTSIDQEKRRAGDWLTVGRKNWDWREFKMGYLNYADWATHAYVGSGLTMIKRSIAKKIGWNERLTRNDNEDIDLHQRLTLHGYIARVNPYASAKAYFWRFGELPHYQFNNQKLGKMQGMRVRRFFATVFRLIYQSPIGDHLGKAYQNWHNRLRGRLLWRAMNR